MKTPDGSGFVNQQQSLPTAGKSSHAQQNYGELYLDYIFTLLFS